MTSVIGHQGAPRVALGNTLPSFRAAGRLGADGIELDVRRTADDGLAVHHDAHLSDGRALLDVASGELPDTVPDLDGALASCAALNVVNVEIKNSPFDGDFDPTLGVAEQVVEVLLARPLGERAHVLVSCFDLPTLDRVRQLAPGLATGWLTMGFATVAQDMAAVAERGHRAVHPHHQAVDVDVVARAHDAGLAVNAWTCDEPDRIRWLAAIGVDAVITNVPDVALAALGRATP